MFTRIRRLIGRFFNKSRTINNEPLNKVSLIVIILIDIFILVNVFTGLNDISQWHLSPTEAYPCYSDWNDYRKQTETDKDYRIVESAIQENPSQFSIQESYQRSTNDRLGEVSSTCLTYAGYKDKIDVPANRQVIKTIDQKQDRIDALERVNQTIRSQYDSTLLEKIAGQNRDQSINVVGAERAKQELDKNNQAISTLNKEIAALKSGLLNQPDSTTFIRLLKDDQRFTEVEKGYQQASFWYPSIQLILQSLFLLPLILVALTVHTFAQRRGYGLIALISWHLLAIFFIPLILKIFEFLQLDVVFQFFFGIVSAIFGGLLFLISYIYILLIPLIGFGIIKFFQKFILNPKVQAANRVQNSSCIRCAKRLRQHDSYCPHCGYFQYTECPNCHNLTYKHLPHCKECGHSQDLSRYL